MKINEVTTVKIAVLMGSARKGNTYNVVSHLEAAVRKQMDPDEQIELIYLWPNQYNSKHCVSCYQCFMKGEETCPHSEIIQPVAKHIDAADLVVFATPVFSLQVSADIKNLIDHMSYKFHRSDYAGKKAIVITTTAGGGHKETAAYLESVLRSWGVDKVYKLPIQCLSLNYEVQPKVQGKLNQIAKQAVLDVQKQRVYNGRFRDAMMFKLWKSLSLDNQDPSNADRIFWEKIRTEGHTYYPNGKISLGTQLLSTGVFSLVEKFVIRK